MDEQNRKYTDAELFNAAVQGATTAEAGVNAGLVVVGAEVAIVGGVVAAPTVASAAATTQATVDTVSISIYVRRTSALASATTAIGNTYRAGVELAEQAVVRVDTLKSGGGAIGAAGSFIRGLVSRTSTLNNQYAAYGRAIRMAYEATQYW